MMFAYRIEENSIMEEDVQAERGISRRTVELVVASIFLLLSVVAFYDNYTRGAGWASDGPQSGYFPARLAVIMFLGSVFTFWVALRAKTEMFVTYEQLIRISKVLIPLIIFTIGIEWLGIYLSSALFLALFMIWLGEFGVIRSCASAFAFVIVTFVIFEKWFQVPLPKGPVEALLGL
ncbi:tripartite tricarboxylate transporter TctB family protein [Candidatus Raskinella chloraquaticus]